MHVPYEVKIEDLCLLDDLYFAAVMRDSLPAAEAFLHYLKTRRKLLLSVCSASSECILPIFPTPDLSAHFRCLRNTEKKSTSYSHRKENDHPGY